MLCWIRPFSKIFVLQLELFSAIPTLHNLTSSYLTYCRLLLMFGVANSSWWMSYLHYNWHRGFLKNIHAWQILNRKYQIMCFFTRFHAARVAEIWLTDTINHSYSLFTDLFSQKEICNMTLSLSSDSSTFHNYKCQPGVWFANKPHCRAHRSIRFHDSYRHCLSHS